MAHGIAIGLSDAGFMQFVTRSILLKNRKKVYLMKRKLICPYCGASVIYAPASKVYGKNIRQKGDHLYLCSRWPVCDAYVSAHRHDGSPMGTLANARLRRKRVKAHDALNTLRQTKHMDKWASYLWLQCKLGLDAEHTHIGAFTEPMCDSVIELCTKEQALAG